MLPLLIRPKTVVAPSLTKALANASDTFIAGCTPLTPTRSPASDPFVNAGRAHRHRHRVAHGAGPWRRVLALIIPGVSLRNSVTVEFVDGGVADLAFQHAKPPRVDDARYRPIARDVLAVVPGVP